MQAAKKNTAIYWFLFFLSTFAFGVAIYMHFDYLTLIIPFAGTFFVKAMDII